MTTSDDFDVEDGRSGQQQSQWGNIWINILLVLIALVVIQTVLYLVATPWPW